MATTQAIDKIQPLSVVRLSLPLGAPPRERFLSGRPVVANAIDGLPT